MQPATTIAYLTVAVVCMGEASSAIERASGLEASEMKRRSDKEITLLMTGAKAISNLSALQRLSR